MSKIFEHGPKWMPVFLTALRETKVVAKACKAAGVHDTTPYTQRKRNRQFAEAWSAALEDREPEDMTAQSGIHSTKGGWQNPFFHALAERSNVSAAAKAANIPLTTVYAERRKSRAFAARWDSALLEGYENLEMELLGYLRATAPDYKMDVANALRLLAAHKETVAKERVRRTKRDKAAILASLNAKIDKMRERKAAAAKLLGEDA